MGKTGGFANAANEPKTESQRWPVSRRFQRAVVVAVVYIYGANSHAVPAGALNELIRGVKAHWLAVDESCRERGRVVVF